MAPKAFLEPPVVTDDISIVLNRYPVKSLRVILNGYSVKMQMISDRRYSTADGETATFKTMGLEIATT